MKANERMDLIVLLQHGKMCPPFGSSVWPPFLSHGSQSSIAYGFLNMILNRISPDTSYSQHKFSKFIEPFPILISYVFVAEHLKQSYVLQASVSMRCNSLFTFVLRYWECVEVTYKPFTLPQPGDNNNEFQLPLQVLLQNNTA